MIAEELVVKKRFIFLTRGYWLEDEHTNSVIMQLLDTVMGQRFVENGNRS